jgi:chitin deacetylase
LFAVIALAQIPVLRLAGITCRRFFPHVLFSIDPNGRQAVALTLDDAPSALTEDVLTILSDHHAHATFFVIGSNAAPDPEILRKIVSHGHELGNHTWCDESTFWLKRPRLKRSLNETHQLLTQVGTVRLVRPGGGLFRPRVLKAIKKLKCNCVLASVYPHDLRVSQRFAVWYVLRFAKPGAIIVLHEGKLERDRVLKTLPTVLCQLKKRYEVTTLSDLLNQTEK